jgi:hypothetical protein
MLQIIELPGLLGEHVHHEVDVIEQDPFRLLVAFNVSRA